MRRHAPQHSALHQGLVDETEFAIIPQATLDQLFRSVRCAGIEVIFFAEEMPRPRVITPFLLRIPERGGGWKLLHPLHSWQKLWPSEGESRWSTFLSQVQGLLD